MNTTEHLRLFFKNFATPKKRDRYLALLDTPKGVDKLFRDRTSFELDPSRCKLIPAMPGCEVFDYLQNHVNKINRNGRVWYWPIDEKNVSEQVHFSILKGDDHLLVWGTLVIIEPGKEYIYETEGYEYICSASGNEN